MSLTVHPGPVEGTVAASPSKSVTHRALVMTFLTNGGTVKRPLWSEDTLATLAGLRALGLGAVATKTELVVRGGASTPAEIDCRNAGTSLRLLTALSATVAGKSTLTGDASLLARPMGPLVDALNQLGAEARCLGEEGRPPVEVLGPATGGKARLDASASSQFVSALLLAGTRMPEGLDLELTEAPSSQPYIDLTIGLMEQAGFEVQGTETGYQVEPQARPPVSLTVPGDLSSASFPLVAAAITGGPVTVTGLQLDGRQGDQAILDLLAEAGAEVQQDGDAVTVSADELTSFEADLADTPDLFPPLCVLATACQGTSRLFGAPHLRHKESDRIAAMTDGLSALGAKIEATDEGARITGGRLTGGSAKAQGDHRIQMALAVAGLRAQDPVTVEGPEDLHAISYPAFLDDLRALGAQVELSSEEGSP